MHSQNQSWAPVVHGKAVSPVTVLLDGDRLFPFKEILQSLWWNIDERYVRSLCAQVFIIHFCFIFPEFFKFALHTKLSLFLINMLFCSAQSNINPKFYKLYNCLLNLNVVLRGFTFSLFDTHNKVYVEWKHALYNWMKWISFLLLFCLLHWSL